MGARLDAAWEQAKAIPGAAARDIARDVGNTYQAILTQSASFNVPLPPGSTETELYQLHNTVEVSEPETAEPEAAAPEPEGPDPEYQI